LTDAVKTDHKGSFCAGEEVRTLADVIDLQTMHTGKPRRKVDGC